MKDFMDKRISLVATYKNVKDEYWYYRIADYDEYIKKLVYVDYDEEQNEFDLERIQVSLYSNEYKKLYQSILKEWQYESIDSERVVVKSGVSLIGKVYEIYYDSIFLNSGLYKSSNSYDSLVKYFTEGFQIDDDINDEFLFVVEEKDDYIVTVLCDKNRFSIKRDNQGNEFYYIKTHIDDIKNDILYLDTYLIKEDDIISTNNLTRYSFMQSIILNERLFYNGLILPEKSDIIKFIDKDEMLMYYIQKYIKEKQQILSLSNAERKKFTELMQFLVRSEHEIQEMISVVHLTKQDIINSMENIVRIVLNLYSGDDQFSNLLEDYLLKDQRIYEKCSKSVKDKWLSENKQMILEADNEIRAAKQELQSISGEKNKSAKEISSQKRELQFLKSEIERKQKEINEVDDEKAKLQNEIKEELAQFKNEIIESTKILGLIESSNSTNRNVEIAPVTTIKEEKYLYSEECKKEFDKNNVIEDEIQNLNDLYELLCDNLEDVISDSSRISLGLIASCITGKSIVIDDFLGRKIADDISLLLSKSTADYYCITSQNIDVNYLIATINKGTSKVAYIEGVLDTFNYDLFLAIKKNCNNRLLIFGVSEDNIQMLSKSVWKYCMYIDYGQCELIDSSNCSKVVSDFTWECNMQCGKVTIPSVVKELYDNKWITNKDIYDIKKMLTVTDERFQDDLLITILNTISLKIDLDQMEEFKLCLKNSGLGIDILDCCIIDWRED